MAKLYVPLRRDEFERLQALARAERRRPQDQAAILIERGLLQVPADADATAGTQPERPELVAA